MFYLNWVNIQNVWKSLNSVQDGAYVRRPNSIQKLHQIESDSQAEKISSEHFQFLINLVVFNYH